MKHPVFLSAILLMLVAAACKKNAETTSKPDCRIIKMTAGQDFSKVFSYDEAGRLLSVEDEQGDVTTFAYSGDSVISKGFSKSVYVLNGNGLPVPKRTEYPNGGWQEFTYQYNGTAIIKASETGGGGYGSSTRTYNWQNGNLQSEHRQGAAYSNDTEYEYYTDKPYRIGDAQSWDFLEDGVQIIRNKNLIKKITATYTDEYGPEKTEKSYSYAFDDDGKITSMTVTDHINNDLSLTYTYEYECL